jgi:hypothetical protein
MSDTQQLPPYKEMVSEILSDAHAIHCAAEVGMPCDCRVPGAIAAMRAEIERLRRERDQYKLVAEMNKQTIKAMSRGEYICSNCGIRKDGEHDHAVEF